MMEKLPLLPLDNRNNILQFVGYATFILRQLFFSHTTTKYCYNAFAGILHQQRNELKLVVNKSSHKKVPALFVT